MNLDDEDEVDGNTREIRNESIGPISDDMDQAGSYMGGWIWKVFYHIQMDPMWGTQIL